MQTGQKAAQVGNVKSLAPKRVVRLEIARIRGHAHDQRTSELGQYNTKVHIIQHGQPQLQYLGGRCEASTHKHINKDFRIVTHQRRKSGSRCTPPPPFPHLKPEQRQKEGSHHKRCGCSCLESVLVATADWRDGRGSQAAKREGGGRRFSSGSSKGESFSSTKENVSGGGEGREANLRNNSV